VRRSTDRRVSSGLGPARSGYRDRGRADGSIARSAPCGAAAPLPREGPVGRHNPQPTGPRGAATRADTAMMEGEGTRPLRVGCPGSPALMAGQPIAAVNSSPSAADSAAQGVSAGRRSGSQKRSPIADSRPRQRLHFRLAVSSWAMGSQGVAAALGVPAIGVAIGSQSGELLSLGSPVTGPLTSRFGGAPRGIRTPNRQIRSQPSPIPARPPDHFASPLILVNGHAADANRASVPTCIAWLGRNVVAVSGRRRQTERLAIDRSPDPAGVQSTRSRSGAHLR